MVSFLIAGNVEVNYYHTAPLLNAYHYYGAIQIVFFSSCSTRLLDTDTSFAMLYLRMAACQQVKCSPYLT